MDKRERGNGSVLAALLWGLGRQLRFVIEGAARGKGTQRHAVELELW